MMLVEKATPSLPAPMFMPAAVVGPSATRKRKIIVDAELLGEKRPRTYTELEFEELLAEAALLREELELLVAVAHDLSLDLGGDVATVRRFSAALQQMEELMESQEDVTLRQVRVLGRQLLGMTQFLCREHYEGFALVDMQDQLRACRNRVMLFVCQHAAVLGL